MKISQRANRVIYRSDMSTFSTLARLLVSKVYLLLFKSDSKSKIINNPFRLQAGKDAAFRWRTTFFQFSLKIHEYNNKNNDLLKKDGNTPRY